ncbi:MAG: hypothetical protein CK429_25180 [Mycobacterium sp.]|nr:MAG: hypothetical protein CK429_25180 [Mycobacterium sp.]
MIQLDFGQLAVQRLQFSPLCLNRWGVRVVDGSLVSAVAQNDDLGFGCRTSWPVQIDFWTSHIQKSCRRPRDGLETSGTAPQTHLGNDQARSRKDVYRRSHEVMCIKAGMAAVVLLLLVVVVAAAVTHTAPSRHVFEHNRGDNSRCRKQHVLADTGGKMGSQPVNDRLQLLSGPIQFQRRMIANNWILR